MHPLYTAFFTLGSLYEQEADRLCRSLDALGLEHDIRGVADRGNWEANSGLTAGHIMTMQAAYPNRPIVQLDADAVVKQKPLLFERWAKEMSDDYCVTRPHSSRTSHHSSPPDSSPPDIAVHYRRGVEMLNGTIWLAPTEPARQVIRRYAELVAAQRPRNEQLMLQNAIGEMSDLLKLYKLAAGYCWIPDIMKDDLAAGEEVVIAHHQASRERGSGPAVDRRRSWIRDWDTISRVG